MEINNLVELEYEALEWKDGNFSSDSMEKLKAMLTICAEGNIIYICHPKHLFDTMTQDINTKEIKTVDFDSINIEKMMQYNDFGRYSIVDQKCSKRNNQSTYLLKKASHMIKKYQKEGLSEFSYPFAILEEIYVSEGEPQYFVRGIVKCDQNGFSLAFNPNMAKTITNESIWEKSLRFSDNFQLI